MFNAPIVLVTAGRFLFSRQKEKAVSVIGVFSLIGVALGVATLVVVMAVMNGFREEIAGKILGMNGHVQILPAAGGYMPFTDALKDAAVTEAGPAAVVLPVVEGQAMVLSGGVAHGVGVKALRQEDLSHFPLATQSLSVAERAAFLEPYRLLLGDQMALTLGVNAGDELTLVSPSVQNTAVGTLPRLKTFTVAGTFSTGMYEYDSNLMLMRQEDAAKFFHTSGGVSRVELRLPDAAKAPGVMDNLRKRFAENGAPQDYVVQSWQEMHAGLFNALKVERSVMFLILSLIVCVAAFNIVSGLMILVRDKYYDVAILKTLGMSRRSILCIFFICGSGLGLAGTFVGACIGVVFALNIESVRRFLEGLTGSSLFDPVIYFLSELPAKLQTSDVVSACAVGLICSCAATLYPAWKAASREPAEALRYD